MLQVCPSPMAEAKPFDYDAPLVAIRSGLGETGA
jgi:hypothetical protein